MWSLPKLRTHNTHDHIHHAYFGTQEKTYVNRSLLIPFELRKAETNRKCHRAQHGMTYRIISFFAWLCVLEKSAEVLPGEGGGGWTTLQPFSQISQKTEAHLFIHLSRTRYEIFRPRSLKVRSPGHVK